MIQENNIVFHIEETETGTDKIINNNFFLYELEYNNDVRMSQVVNYNENYNVKDLITICDYYGLAKEIKKLNKNDIVYFLVNFENNIINNSIVEKRKKLWNYMNELKNDKFMKKFVIWN